MTADDLKRLAHREGFSWAEGEHDGKRGFFLHWDDPRSGGDVAFVDADALPGLDWPTVRGYAIGGRNIVHMTRIVGYYSRLDNWNPSKLGELKDRRAGDYGVGRSARPCNLDPDALDRWEMFPGGCPASPEAAIRMLRESMRADMEAILKVRGEPAQCA